MVNLQNFSLRKGAKEFTEPYGEINTTPLVDVMLVLLIIFLITIPVINASIKVDLPEEKFSEEILTDEIGVISVTAEGNIFFNGTFLGDSQKYTETLSNLFKSNKIKFIQVHGDAAVSFKKIESVINQLRLLGIEKITLVTRP